MYENENVTILPLHEEVKNSFMDYAMSVIVSRALPDVRDGLKPVHRRILYAMQELGTSPDKPHKKSARIVGEVLGKYHPHGDQAVYEAMVRLAQDFTSRYPLVDGHGNFGSMDGDSAAAMRYTEARLSPLAMEMLRDLEKETVDWRLNFDETLEEPVVLPSRLPNLLINGSAGIAVGMATNIPPHNLSETIDAICALIDDPDLTDERLLDYMKGPDFPTGGIILGQKGIRDAFLTGRGTVQVRGKTSIEREAGKDRLLITEIPYQQNKARLIEKIAELVRERKIDGISDLRDESDRSGVRIVIEVKKNVNPHVILNQLYKYTPLQQSFGIIMLSLVDGYPRVLGLKNILFAYLDHQKEVVTRRSQFLLRRARDRAHIVEGLRIALDHLDEVIALIRGSRDADEARRGLVEQFHLSEKQAQAILDMRLQRLTALEREKLEEEYRSLMEEIAYLEALLADDKLILREIRREMGEIKARYGDERLTQIVPDEEEIELEDLILEEQVVVTITHQGYIKRIPLSTYRQQHRGGRGVMAHSIREKDFIKQLFVSSTREKLLCFSNLGRAYPLRVYKIPEAGRQARGTAIINLLPLQSGEYITAVFPLGSYEADDQLVLATKSGFVKKTRLKEYMNARRSGVIAIDLVEGDELISVKSVGSEENDRTEEPSVMLVTRQGWMIRFSVSQLRFLGRTARGVRGISLYPEDRVVGMVLASGQRKDLLLVSEKGYGKRTRLREFRAQNRGGKGLMAYRHNEDTGELAGFCLVEQRDEFIIITAQGLVIRETAAQVPVQGRYARGVKLIRLSPDDKAVNIAAVTGE